MRIKKSIAFIQTRGSDLEKARLQCILHGIEPHKEISRSLFELQNANGGFPLGMKRGNLSTIHDTTIALWWLEELNLLSSPAADQAMNYLLRTQQADGSWDEDLRLAQYSLPPWIQPGDRRTKVYLTAYAVYWLTIAGKTSLPALHKALQFLIQNQDETGKFYGYLHSTWIATGAFILAGKRYSSIASQGLSALMARSLSGWVDSQIAWALDCLSKGGLPRSDPFVHECLQELSRRQRADGSWASEDGETSAVSTTIQSLKVLKRYGVVKLTKQGT